MISKGQLLQQAQQAHAENRFDEAVELCQQVIASEPDDLHARLLAGISATKAGQQEAAFLHLTRCLELDSGCFPADIWLAYLLCNSGRAPEAIRHAERALAAQPNHPEVHQILGLCMLATGNNAAAKGWFERAISNNRTSATFHFGLSQALERLGELPQALVSLRRAVKYSGDPAWRFKLGRMELAAGNGSKAREIAVGLLAADPASSRANHLMANVLQAEHKESEAQSYLEKAAELDPTNEIVLQEIGVRHQSAGYFEDALVAFQKAIDINPDQGGAYYGVTSSKRVTEEDLPLIQSMERVSTEGRIDANERTMLEYALGKAYQDLRDPARAMAHFDVANKLSAQLNFGNREFDRAGLRSDIDRSINLFTQRFIEAHEKGSPSDTPVFVVGMVRSGTTLMEHILSCHPDVGAAGEQGFWAEQESGLVDYAKGSIDVWALRANADAYLHLIREIAPGKPRITDKNPANVLCLGLIHLAFPNAKILHMVRHPVDTLLSIYTTAIKNPPPFACDKNNLVFAYREYLRVVDHWRNVLPASAFLDVRYEQLVANPEEETRGVLEFLGLPWNAACAVPERNSRRVNTPSLWQVRQPIHQGSTRKWEAYRPWLGPFAEFLDEPAGQD